MKPLHLLSLADLSAKQILFTLEHSARLKSTARRALGPVVKNYVPPMFLSQSSLINKSIALLFSKRSTRTRLAAETAIDLLGGNSLFLGKDDIQLGVNETPRDTVQVMSGMVQGIFARVGDHSEIEELAKYSAVPVVNALSNYWHPTQILADLLTLHEYSIEFQPPPIPKDDDTDLLPQLRPLTVAWLGDSTNILHDMLVAYPRLGHKLRVATPEKTEYRCPKPVWDAVVKLGCDKDITWVSDPREAVQGADVVVTDTWVSMGQEAEKAQRLQDFEGYQVTEALCKEGGANPNWKFLHCLPRKPDEVDDEVFYGPRSLVFPESWNRKWTTMAVFDLVYGRWNIPERDEWAQDLPLPKAWRGTVN